VVTRALANPHRDLARLELPALELARPRHLHERLPGYRPTPLARLAAIASELGLGTVLAKDESLRLELPAFKVLGASWAVYRHACRELGREELEWPAEGAAEMRRAFAPLATAKLVTATDGNHVRGVARVARLFGLGAEVHLPAGTAAARVAAIEEEGALAVVVDGPYEAAVESAARSARRGDAWLVQDTSWDGYEWWPTRIVEGYGTLFCELEEQADGPPDLVVVPVGVGALALTALVHYRSRHPGTRIVGVEPLAADCLFASLAAGERRLVPGPHDSILAGLNCGLLATIAWPVLRDGLDGTIAVDDGAARTAVRLLAREGLAIGESGAASLAGLVELVRSPAAAGLREALGIGPATRALVLATEGVTDPVGYARLLA